MSFLKQPGKEIVWVLGDSGAGKETFIRHITSQPQETLLRQTGWINKRIGASALSRSLLGKKFRDEITAQRDSLIEEVDALIDRYDVVLIKGQMVDIEDERVQRLRKLLPVIDHKLIYLDAGLEGAFERWRTKSWWSESHTIQQAASQRTYHFDLMMQLQGFPLMVLSSKNSEEYSEISPPPELSEFEFDAWQL